MQRQKNIQLLISLVIIIAVTVIIFIFSNSKNNSDIDKNIFQIDNLEKIDRIILESSKAKTELTFDGIRWRVNGKLEADDQMITVLFATLKQTQAKRPVASHLQDSLQKEIEKNGIKISCYEGSKLSKVFESAGNSAQTETYFQLPNDKPYLVVIPGYRVFLASIFEMTQNDWRNKRVFNFNWQNIKSLEVVFSAEPKQNFKASFLNGLFGIEGIKTDTTKLDRFMDALFQLQVEKFLDSAETKKQETTYAKPPLITIQIQDVGSRVYPFAIYPYQKGSEFLQGKINETPVLLNPRILQEVFKRKNYFIQQ
ncbi:MAG: DUF4340 domain-containing protein [Bacteroidetes bacterium]|nr:DUF4340 domain-containing protein [Bacteroidota bacterium]